MFAYYMKILKFNNGNYKGNVKNSLPHGIGEFEKYKIVKNFSVSGKELTKEINEVYKGDWKNGKYNGKGKLKITINEEYLSSIDIYSGNWKNNVFEGNGKHFQYLDGELVTKYTGTLKKLKYHGKGTLTHLGYSRFNDELNKDIGNFKNGKLDGKSIIIDSLLEYENFSIVEELLSILKKDKKLEKKLGITSTEDLERLNTYLHNNGWYSLKNFKSENGEKGEIFVEKKGIYKNGKPKGIHVCNIFYQKFKIKKKLIATYKGILKKKGKHSEWVKKSLSIHD